MSQPPGQFGEPPGPYGPPAPPYGPGVGPGGYGGRPPANRALPWLIVGAAVLLSALGLLIVVLFTRDDDATPAVATATPTEPTTSSLAVPPRSRDTGGLAGGATSTASRDGADTVGAGSAGRYAGSGDVALAWVQAMADGDVEAAFARSCPAVQQAAVAADDGSGPAWMLATYFFEQTLGGVGFTEGTFDGLVHDAASASDVATFTLQLDTGEAFPLLVYVGPDLTVCDFR